MELEKNKIKDESEDSRLFNDGKAGIVEVFITDVSRQPNDGFRRIIFLDSAGRQFVHYYNYLDTNEGGFKKRLRAQGIKLKHFWKVIIGQEPIPIFESPRHMLDTIIDEIYKKSIGRKFRIAVDYGYPPRLWGHLVLKKYTPFIEDASIKESRLFLSRKAYKNRNRSIDY